MSTITCNNCEKHFREEDTVPFQRNQDGTFLYGCRKCVTIWLKEGFLRGDWPFWARKEGVDSPERMGYAN